MEKQLTAEQQAIVDWNGDCTINAVAGSGKTSTIIAYAASRPEGSRILYLAFNKSVKEEAVRKFTALGLHHVTVETAHSLAFRHVIPGSKYTLRSRGYATHETAAILALQGDGDRHTEYIIANHINKFVAYFCNSAARKVQELNYLDKVTDAKARLFVQRFYPVIETGTRRLLASMERAEIDIIHDFYLKKFQLNCPALPYEYILFDEGQDASAAMLDVFNRQNAIRLIVGDTHQQIYSWRYAVNSLAQTTGQRFRLSASFRFPAAIAGLAMEILQWKEKIDRYEPVTITGKGKAVKPVTTATIARTNLGLLLNAIDYISRNRKTKHIYFEGNINSYTYADDGASLYDVLNLYNGNRDRIRDPLIASLKDMKELEEYIETTEDLQLGMMAEIVNEYENEVFTILQNLKNLHTGDADRHKAEMIFSTVHRAKGMEYDTVYLVNDFMSESKLDRTLKEAETNKQPADLLRLNEEINLLYVAVTRARHKLFIPESLLPRNVAQNSHIQVIRNSTTGRHEPVGAKKGKATAVTGYDRAAAKERKKLHTETKNTAAGAYTPWSTRQDDELVFLYETDNSIYAIAEHFGRTRGAILSRLHKLGYYTE